MTIAGLLLILAFVVVFGVGLLISYQRGFDAGLKHGERGSIKLTGDNLEIVHWLAQNGFRRLLLIGPREKGVGFQTRKQAEDADWALGHLEHYLPKEENTPDYRWDRMSSIVTRWPEGKAPRVRHNSCKTKD